MKATYFCDTSAIIKLYHAEIGTDCMGSIFSDNQCVIMISGHKGGTMETVLNKFDDILIKAGGYSNKKSLIDDALRALLRARPLLKQDMAIELYKVHEISLSRAAEISGLDIENFKEALIEKGVRIQVADIPVEEINEEVEKILEAI